MLLDIQNLRVDFRNEGEPPFRAVDGVSLRLDRGEVLGLVGESGSGKSTVAMSVPRLLPSPPASWPEGRILLDGRDTLKMTADELRTLRGRHVGVVFQDPMGSLSPLHRIGEQLVETVRLHTELSVKSARELALDWLARVGVPEPSVRCRAYPHELSGGQQQRVMIAMAMMLEPDLLIADEPTTALDVTVQAQILELMRELLKRAHAGVLLITHDLGVVSAMATKLAVMSNGVVVETAAEPEEFFKNPKHPHSQGLVREAKKMELR